MGKKEFYIPDPDDFGIERTDLSYGMRTSSRYYTEIVAPGIASAFRVRHFSWSVAALYLQTRFSYNKSPSSIANAIEALANRLDQRRSRVNNIDVKIRGIRSYDRNSEIWKFDPLTKRENYVLITHRQQTSRALPDVSGLGFTRGSTRFNRMFLTENGQKLADIFLSQKSVGQGKPYLDSILDSWINDDFSPADYKDVPEFAKILSQFEPTEEERNIVYNRLNSKTNFLKDNDTDKRIRLIMFCEKFIKRKQQWNDIDSLLSWLKTQGQLGKNHAKCIEISLNFEDMRSTALDLTKAIVLLLNGMPPKKRKVSIDQVTQDKNCRTYIKAIQRTAKKFLTGDANFIHSDAKLFANQVLNSERTVVHEIVNRDSRVITFVDDDIRPGVLFYDFEIREQNDTADEDELIGTRKPARIFQFIELWRDARGHNNNIF